MDKRTIATEQITAFEKYMINEERARATIDKYCACLRCFLSWLDGREITKELTAEYKRHLISIDRAPITINAAIAAIHAFYDFAGWRDCRIKYLKIQRRMFRESSRELTRHEYERLTNTAVSQGKTRTALVIETICATGIRVSELKYITVEALSRGRTDVSLKGKIRVIIIPSKLCRKLLKYARKSKIDSGEIFLTKSGRSLSRRQIWSDMKKLCKEAGIEASKVFPHNLRHLFAVSFYKACKDLVALADILGHSSIETTRIYLISTVFECKNRLEKLRLAL